MKMIEREHAVPSFTINRLIIVYYISIRPTHTCYANGCNKYREIISTVIRARVDDFD